MKLNFDIREKRGRERLLIIATGLLLLVFFLIEFRLVSTIKPLPKYTNVLVFVVININLLLILVLSFLVIRNLVKLIFEERIHLLGARLKTKLTIGFIIISLLPTLLLFFISFQFLRTSLAYWFDTRIEYSLEQALAVGRSYYQSQVKQLKDVENILVNEIKLHCLSDEGPAIDRQCVENLLAPSVVASVPSSVIRYSSVNSMELLDAEGRILLKKTWLPLTESLPPVNITELRKKRSSWPLVLHFDINTGTVIRVVQPILDEYDRPLAYLSVGRFLSEDIVSQLEDIRQGFEGYKRLKVFQDPLKTSLLSTLFLITMLIIFVSVWFAFKLAKGITEPVQMLAEATQRVAQGDLDFRLEPRGRDELSSLVRAFNTMTRDLKEARRRAEEASRQLLKSYTEIEHRKAYIEMLLENITAGVISLDREGRITTINRSACEILQKDANYLLKSSYRELLGPGEIQEFENIRKDLFVQRQGSVKRSIKVDVGGESRSLLVNFSMLRDKDDRVYGILIVFDDLTDMERIQRIAAWRDVARRIAHEVKNPLTPIKLSAQRLNRKFHGKFSGRDLEVFERCTQTIISQADELKRLVDEFSRFARMPAPVLRRTSLSRVIKEAAAVYQDMVDIRLDIPEGLPQVKVDSEQIKRVFINIIDNAISAGKATKVHISVSCTEKGMEVLVKDNGKGVGAKDISRIFEPYYSKKKGGTGLGLAIVKSILEAHDARITAEPNEPTGLVFKIIFSTT